MQGVDQIVTKYSPRPVAQTFSVKRNGQSIDRLFAAAMAESK